MSIEKLIELMDEYTDLWSKLNKQEREHLRGTMYWHMAYSIEERRGFRQRCEAIEQEVTSVGLEIGRDEHDLTCLWRSHT